MLILLSGPDRVGKSTLAGQLSQLSGFQVRHHSAPDLSSPSIFSMYRESLEEGKSQIWDRSYVCAFILERWRRRNHDHFIEIVDLELELSKHHKVIHVGLTRPWHWSAPLHLDEIREEFPGEAAPWAVRDLLLARQNEHFFYTEEMLHFYERHTMFPSFMVDPEWTAEDVWRNIQAIDGREVPQFSAT